MAPKPKPLAMPEVSEEVAALFESMPPAAKYVAMALGGGEGYGRGDSGSDRSSNSDSNSAGSYPLWLWGGEAVPWLWPASPVPPDGTSCGWSLPPRLYEFAEEEWCLACAARGVAMLEEAIAKGRLDVTKEENNWAFSEEYTETPERLMQGRDMAVYWFYLKDGVARGGAGGSIPEECLALPGFHIAAPWGEIVHPSGFVYDYQGQQERSKHVSVGCMSEHLRVF